MSEDSYKKDNPIFTEAYESTKNMIGKIETPVQQYVQAFLAEDMDLAERIAQQYGLTDKQLDQAMLSAINDVSAELDKTGLHDDAEHLRDVVLETIIKGGKI